VGLDFRNAVEHCTLEIELHHHAQSLCEAGVHADGKIERANKRSPAPSRPRCQGRVVFAFTGAKRTPLTGEAGGLGAVFPQEGQKGDLPAGSCTKSAHTIGWIDQSSSA